MLRVLLLVVMSMAAWSAQSATIITGLAGDETGTAAQIDEVAAWRTALAGWEVASIDGGTATDARTRIATALAALAERADADALVVFIGQGSTRGGAWRFQNRGQRLTADEVAVLPGRLRSLTVVFSGPGGAGLAPRLTGPRTVFIAASDDPGDVNRTEFGGRFAALLAANPGRPLTETIDAAAVATAELYRSRSALPTERAAVWWPDGSRLSCPLQPPLPQVLLARWTLGAIAVPMGVIPAGPATAAGGAATAAPGAATAAQPPAVNP
jgi:hypothetical protein